MDVSIAWPYIIQGTGRLIRCTIRYGGGFTSGASSALIGETTAVPGILYQGANIVQRSVEMDQPVIFVSFNYRLNAFGFSGGKEIEDAGVTNLGLKDQRMAMQWVQKHISEVWEKAHFIESGSLSINTSLSSEETRQKSLSLGNPRGLGRFPHTCCSMTEILKACSVARLQCQVDR